MSKDKEIIPYVNYRDSGVEWLGQIPSDWVVQKVSRIAKFFSGGTPPTEKHEYFSGEESWASIADLKDGVLRETHKKLSLAGVEKARIAISPVGSLLYSFKLSVGKVAITTFPTYTNEAIATFIPSKYILAKYAFYSYPVFLIRNAKENIYGAPLLNADLIRQARLPLPAVPTQQRIVDYLDTETARIDNLVGEMLAMVDLLKEERKVLISETVTRGIAGEHTEFKDSGIEWLGQIPSNWIVRKLKLILSAPITDGPHETPTFIDEGIPFLSVDGIQNGELAFNDKTRFISLEAHHEYKKKANPQKGDILLGKAASVGKVAQIKTDIEFSIWSPLALLKPEPTKIISGYLEYLLKSPLAKQQIDDFSTYNTQQNIAMKDIARLRFPFPVLEEQKVIVADLDIKTARIDLLISETKAAIALLKEERKVLISDIVTGKLEV